LTGPRRYASNGVGIYVLNIERPLNLLTRDEIMDYIIFYRERVTPTHYDIAQMAWNVPLLHIHHTHGIGYYLII